MSVPSFAIAPLPNETTEPVKESNPCDISVQDCILKYFPEQGGVAIAVFTAESHLNSNAIGYNCVYGDRVKTCNKEDRVKAISVDCGLTQIHSYTGTCDKKLFNTEYNLQIAKGMYEKRGFTPWCAYTKGNYLAYLSRA